MNRSLLNGLRPRDERGAIAVITAILLVAMFSLVALVIDIAALRADARAGQSTGDFASVAGGLSIDPSTGGSLNAACQAAYRYFVANTQGLGGQPSSSSQCDAFFPPGMVCEATTPATSAVIPVGPYTLTITMPIPDDHPLMQGRSNPEIDGDPCVRIAVQVGRERGYLFGGLVGQFSGNTEPPAVARSAPGTQAKQRPALIVLDPHGCDAIDVSGGGAAGGFIWVKPGPAGPGIIAVDSDASQATGAPERRCDLGVDPASINARGSTGTVDIQAGGTVLNQCASTITDGLITSFALMGPNASKSYHPDDITACRLAPTPVGHERITRAPIDHRYNCKSSYSYLSPNPTTNNWGVPVSKCTDGNPPYIDNLRSAIGTSGVPSGFTELTGLGSSAQPCTTNGNKTIDPGKWFVNCPSGFTVATTDTLIFRPGAFVVFAGGLHAMGRFCYNVESCSDSSSSSDAVLYLRQGNLTRGATATINLMRTMVYLGNGTMNFGGGSGPLTWESPHGPQDTATCTGLPQPECFEALSLWSESGSQHSLNGQGGLDLVGTFFVPNAQFIFSGQPPLEQQRAQFFTWRIRVTGQGRLTMQPDPVLSTPIPFAGVLLIR